MIAVLIVWIILFTIFLALGDVLLQLYKKFVDGDYTLSVINTFFIGLCAGQIIACTSSIFLPLNKYVFLIIVAFVSLYWLVRRKRLISIVKSVWNTYMNLLLLGKIFSVFIGLIVLYHTSSPSAAPDEFLYHLQGIKWLQEYGVVNGLANLHIRFGFNSSALSIFSLFTYHPDLRIGFTALNGLCLFMFSTWLSYKIFRVENAVEKLIYTITLVIFVHFYAMELSSTSTDVIVNVLVAYLILICFFAKDMRSLYLPLATIPVLCVTLKLSSALIVLISLYVFWHMFKEKKIASLVSVVVIAALISIPWIVQNIILSGYVIFPFPSIDLFSFDWKVPVEIAAREKEITYNWARGVKEVGDNSFAWIPTWYNKTPEINKVIYIISAISIFLFVFTIRKLKYNKLALLGCVTAGAGALFGFLTAPELRFSLGFTITTSFIFLLFLCQKEILKSIPTTIVQWCFVAAFAFFHVNYISHKVGELSKMESTYLRAQLVKPFPVSYAKKDTQFDLVKVNNVEVYIPRGTGLCYDFDLPCAPYAPSNIELRGADMESGFRIKQ